jgi:mannosyltransferase
MSAASDTLPRVGQASDRAPRPTSYRNWLLAITAGGAVLRFALLGFRPYWRDEAFTALAVHRSVGAMLSVVAHDSAPPLSYLIQHLVVSVVGGQGGLRLTSAIAGSLAIPLGGALGRRVGGDRVGLWCATTFAVFPSLVLASRDARTYALATTLVLATILTLWRLVERPSWPRAAVYAGCVVGALYTNYFAAFAVIAELAAALIILRADRRRLSLAVLAASVAALTLTPWLVYARAQFAHGSSPFWVGSVGFSTVGGVVVQFFGGPSIDAGVPGALALQVLQGVAVAIGVTGAVVLAARVRRRQPHLWRPCAFLAVCGLGGIALLVLVSVWHPLVEARYASIMWGPVVCLVGVGFSAVRWHRAATAGLVVLAGISIVLSVALTQPNTPALARDLGRQVRGQDLVASSPASYLLLLAYGNPATRSRTRIVSRDVPWYWGTAVFPPGGVLRRYPVRAGSADDRIFYVEVPGQPSAASPPAGYRPVHPRRCYSTICVTVYTRPR